MKTCDRCGITDRSDRIRTALVNRAREAVRDGRRHDGPDYAHEERCADREACEARRERTQP